MKDIKNGMKKAVAMAMLSVMVVGSIQLNAYAYGEVKADNTSFRNASDASADYQSWLTTEWNNGEKEYADSGKVALTPGKDEKSLNLAWYAVSEKAVPAVKVWKDGSKTAAKIVTGKADAIDALNWQEASYKSACKVAVEDYFEAGEKYCYQYTDNYTTDEASAWSDTFSYTAAKADAFSVILTGDPQVGASDSKTDYSANDVSVSRDTFNWNKTVEEAMKICPNAAFLLSAGDQVDKSGAEKVEDKKTRESEYAGYLYPSVFRSLPIATTIGNHDMAGSDYSNHFNNPNSEAELGKTAAGCDYYFSYGNVLFISLNSNNRNQEEHRTLMKSAVASNPDAKWKVVIFHSDIYGSGQPHADTDASTNRIIFAPLMDEFEIDVCFTGHDHTYSRSKFIVDGNVMDYDYTKNSIDNPEGTLYITTGSGSGSKYYDLLNYTPYYIAERTNACLPAFSTVDFSDSSLTIKTYDYNGEKYADDYTINKTADALDVKSVIKEAEDTLNADTIKNYTDESVNALKTAVDELNAFIAENTTAEDEYISTISTTFNTENDVVKGYGSVANNDDKDSWTAEDGKAIFANRFMAGKSTLLDKTIYTQLSAGAEIENAKLPIVDAAKYSELVNKVVAANKALELKNVEAPSTSQEQPSQVVTEAKPNSDAPKTGDSANVLIYAIMTLLSGAVVFRKRK